MDHAKEQKLRDNLHHLINETNNEDEVLNILKQKNVITQAEFNDIAKAASPMGLKSQMFYLILKKDDYAYHHLIEAFKETENEACVGILTGTIVEPKIESPPPPKIEVEVFVQKADDVYETTPDIEGIAIADEIEKELDRIESEDDSRAESEASFAFSEQQNEETEAQLAPAPKPRKGVSFDNKAPEEPERPTSPLPEETATVTINDLEEKKPSEEEQGEEDPSQWKSIVATNREKFGGEGKFNKAAFAKRGTSLDKEAEPESQVTNLKKYFQRLSSVEQR